LRTAPISAQPALRSTSLVYASVVRSLTETSFPDFVREKHAAAVLFDAEWDIDHRSAIRREMLVAEEALGDRANFGEVDSDECKELAKSIPILNVPSVVYFIKGTVMLILIGAEQNVRATLEHLLQSTPE
jgi:thioredoxin-like negative regulator of GroEL